MNDDLTFWRKLVLSLTNQPKTDSDISWLYRKLARPEIPASALWDAEKGAQKYFSTNGPNTELSEAREKAIKNRGWGLDQTAADMPVWTPTRGYMEQLLNPDVLVVPRKEDMSNIW